jgi:gas vesicle protein
MRVFGTLVLGVIIGGVVVWLYRENRDNPHVRAATDQIETTAKSAGDTIHDKMQNFHLDTADIKDELARTGQVIRQKASDAGKKIADATADARITTTIKGKLLADHDLSVVSISVNTTAGVVTLSGTVTTMDDISKAMYLALNTDGVDQVVSTLQVKPTT